MRSSSSILITISFLFFGTAIIICSLTPINNLENSILGPDFLFCFIFMFLLKRPQNTHLLSILFLSVMADFLWYRPIGLTTLTVVVGSEFARLILNARDKLTLIEEISLIALIITFSTLTQEVIKILVIIPSLGLRQILNYMISTFLVYLLITIMINMIKKSKLV